jgi:drug/metabolite transporter (DMT)-like permease
MTKPNIKSYTLLLMLAAIWGSAFFNYKIILESFDFFILTTGRLFFAALVLALISIFYKKIDYSPIFTKDFYVFFLIGIINYIIPFSLIAMGIDGMSSGLAALLMGAGPFYAIIFSHLLGYDKFNKFKILGTITGFFSVFILVYDQVYLSQSSSFISVLLVMLASLSYVIGSLFIQKYKKYNNQTISLLSMSCGFVILAPFCIYELITYDYDQFKLGSLVSLIYLGIFSTALAFMMRIKLIFDNGIIFMSQVSLLIPIFGVYFSWIFLNESYTANMIISLIITILGLIILQKGYRTSSSI